jgi:hypothetical protein
MTHHIDINGVQAVEVGAVIPDLLGSHGGRRYSRRVIVRTQFGLTTLNLYASSAGQLELSPAPSGPAGKSTPPVSRNKR